MNGAAGSAAPPAPAGAPPAPSGAPAGSPPPPSLITPSGAPPAAAPPAGVPAVAETWWKGYQKEDGTLDKSRLDHLPDELKPDRSILERFNTFEDLAKSFVHARKLVSQKGLTPLREGATEAEMKEHMETLARINGTPKTPQEYGMTRPEGVPEEAWNQPYVDEMAAIMHKHAVSPALAKELMAADSKWSAKIRQESADAQARAFDETFNAAEQKLSKTFGHDRERMIRLAERGARTFGGEEFAKSQAFHQNADVIIAMARAAEAVSDDKLVGAETPGTTHRTAQEQLDDMKSNPANEFYAAIHDPGKHPAKYQQALREIDRLANQAAAAQKR